MASRPLENSGTRPNRWQLTRTASGHSPQPAHGQRAALCVFKEGCHDAEAARDVALFLLLGYGRALRRGEVAL